MSNTSLIYPVNKLGCKNVLLIDTAVPEAQLFVDAANADTFPILYSYSTTRTELLAVLQQHFTSIDRLGLVFTTEGSGRPKRFIEQAPFFTASEATATATSSPYSVNVEFIISILRQFQIKNIDYLACATLAYPEWVNYYAILSRETTVIVGASNDKTGNLQYGGDWVLESTSEDIELIYFTESIEYYTHLLDATGDFTIVMKGTTIYGTGTNGGNLGLNNLDDPVILLTPMVDPSNGAVGTYYGNTPKYIACGQYHTIVLMTNGLIYGTGFNENGQLGLNNLDDPVILLTPMVDPSGSAAGTYYGKTPKYIACGKTYTIVLMTDGTLYGTGLNTSGQLGLNNLTSRKLTLTQMVDPSGGAAGTYYGNTPKYITCGHFHTIVLMTNGSIYGTGSNAAGQLGLNNLTQKTTLTPMVDPSNGAVGTYYGNTPKYIACGTSHTIVLMTNGSLYGTGLNTSGQLGINNTTSPKTTLTPMVDPSNGAVGTYYGKTPKYIACGSLHTIVLMTDGTIYGTGSNAAGQLGINNTTSPKTTLTPMVDPSGGAAGTYYGKTPSFIACGQTHTIVLMTDGTVYGTGDNFYGNLGLNNTTSPITTLTPMVDASGGNTYLMNYYDPVTDPPVLPCFLVGTKILTKNGYRAIETLRKGDLVKTLLDGFQPIELLGYSTIEHPGTSDRRKDQLYVCAPAHYPEVVEDLVLTGAHSLLVDQFTDDRQRQATEKVLKKIYVTDEKYRLPACVDSRATVYNKPGTYTIYHLALQNENYYFNYGIFANGLLVETCSLRYLKECSGMTLVD
jgi:alpha-tubulin suppressor-like RCC1 family protein